MYQPPTHFIALSFWRRGYLSKKQRKNSPKQTNQYRTFVNFKVVETEKNISDRELLNIFQKVQNLEPSQLAVVKDVVSAYLLKTDLQKNLIAK
jgi:hypothetical protein